MKKFSCFSIMVLFCILIGLWSPWLYWSIDIASIFGVKKPEEISALQVYSISGELEVFLNEESKGKVTVEKSPLIVDNINPGENLIEVKRVGPDDSVYWSFKKIINFEKNTDVILSYNIGPSQEFSEGHIIYAVEKQDTQALTKLNVITDIPNANVQVDSLPPEKSSDGKVSISVGLDSQHKVKVSKTGFETLEFTILPESQEDRNVFKNFDLNVEVKLMYQPIEVE